MQLPMALTGSSSPYEAVLGEAFARLEPSVQRAHRPPLFAHGWLDVDHGSHPLTPLLIRLLKLPDAGRSQPVQLEVVSTGHRVAWTRRIGLTVLRTVQHARGERIVEQNGLGCVEFALRVEQGALEYQQRAMSVALVPVPAFVRPDVRARISGAPRGWHVDVTVTWRNHLVCRYSGLMSVA